MDFRGSALLLVAHGSSFDKEAAVPTRCLAERLRSLGIFGEVTVAFWKEEPFFRDALAKLDFDKVFIVPNFISRGYFTETVLPREFAISGPVSQIRGRTVYYCDPVGTHPLMTEALLHSAAAATSPLAPDPAETSLLIAGHGTLRNKNSATVICEQARKISQAGPYAECLAVFMEETPLVGDWATLTTRPNVIVVPFFIAEGPHFSGDLPQMLGFQDANAKFPLLLRGKRLWYARPVGQDEKMTEVVLAQVRAAVS
jgi:sirohydrochlorin cobaltochelatase